jgi:hypothetical protein
MSIKKHIRQILKEGEGESALYDKVGRSSLMYYYKQKKAHYEKNEKELLPFDEWVDHLKKTYPSYGDFGHAVQVTATNSPILDGLSTEQKIKVLSDYILNHNEGGKKHRIDVVTENQLSDYVEDRLYDLNCTDTFFELVWDNILQDKRNRWNENIKGRMWMEIKDEVLDKMEDEEWQEENAISFDSIDREEDYFKSYWHYPIQNLGWDKMELCDWYGYYLDYTEVVNFISKNKATYDYNLWSEFPLEGEKWYIIKRELFH